jgi:hypothetical protein
MAEVIDYWPSSRKPAPQQFTYPWAQWTALDDEGHGDIWLAQMGIDWAEGSHVANFKNTVYTRLASINKKREKNAPVRVMRVKGTDTVRRVSDYQPLRVKFRVVSDTQVAFQFYTGDEAPPEPTVRRVAVPRRKPIHQRVNTSALQKVPVHA